MGEGIQARLKKLTGIYCEKCGKEGKLNVHHKDKNMQNNDLFNLILLCDKCHSIAHKEENKGKICITCHKHFEPKSTNQMYCGEGCRRKAREILEVGTEEEFQQFQKMKQQILANYKKPKFFKEHNKNIKLI